MGGGAGVRGWPLTARQLGGACAGRQPGALAGYGLHQLREASGGAASRTAAVAASASMGGYFDTFGL